MMLNSSRFTIHDGLVCGIDLQSISLEMLPTMTIATIYNMYALLFKARFTFKTVTEPNDFLWLLTAGKRNPWKNKMEEML